MNGEGWHIAALGHGERVTEDEIRKLRSAAHALGYDGHYGGSTVALLCDELIAAWKTVDVMSAICRGVCESETCPVREALSKAPSNAVFALKAAE